MFEPEPKPLTGKALLQKANELSHLPQREKAKLCGYYSLSRNQRPRINLTEFYLAITAASGIDLGTEAATKNGRGRERTYRVSVHKNGQIVIGAAYTAQMDLKPGDEFEIKLGYKHIHLKQLDPEE